MAYHCLTQARDAGSCRRLRGTVLFYLVFVNEPGQRWTDAERRKVKAYFDRTAKYLMDSARRERVGLQILRESCQLFMKEPMAKEARERWRAGFAKARGYRDMKSLHGSLLYHHKAQEAAFIFASKRRDRSYAMQAEKDTNSYVEALTLYWDLNRQALLHEILHLFGAEDYYYPTQVKAAARKYFPYSVMLNASSPVIDDLTKYLIGWTDQLTPRAQAMLRDTADVSKQLVDVSRTHS